MALAHTDTDSIQASDRNAQPDTIELYWRTSWDFFSGSNGSKTGYITDLKETGCTLKTAEPIEFRRWIRMIIRDKRTNVGFTAVGRVVRCENAFEASVGSEVTLYRFRVEFTYPIDLAQLRLNSQHADEVGALELPIASRTGMRIAVGAGIECSGPTSA